MKTQLLFLSLFIFIGDALFCQNGLHIALSPLQELTQTVGKTKMKMTYSRPAIRGRKIFGDLVPYDQFWRTGANRNSKIQFSEPVKIGGKKIEKGTYAILTKPGKVDWEFYLYSDTTNWEVPHPWMDSLVAVKTEVPAQHLSKAVKSMEFSIGDLTYESCTLILAWENTAIEIPIELYTEEQMTDAIHKVLNGPRPSDYTSAAVYRLESGKVLDLGILWIDKAIDLREKPSFYDYLVKAKLIYKSGDKKKALTVAEESLRLAEKTGNRYRIELVTSFLDKLE